MNNIQKLVMAYGELTKNLTLQIITEEPTTFELAKRHKEEIKKENKLRKQIAKLERKIIEEETIK